MEFHDYYDRIPEYYPTMYMDGYTPTEILHATHKLMNRQFAEQEAAAAVAPEDYTVSIKSEVRLK